MKQFLYVMKSAFGHCKVGISIDPMKRMNAIRTGHGGEVSLIATYGPFNAATKLESAVHDALSESRMLGEWFDCSESDVIRAVKACLESFIDDEDISEEAAAIGDRMAKELALMAMKPSLDLEETARGLLDLVKRYRETCDQWEVNFIEANELLEFYADHAKHFSLVAQKAMDQVQRLESQIAEMKSGCAVA